METLDSDSSKDITPSKPLDVESLSMWEVLPSQVYRRLFTYLSDSSVKTVRFVCPSWKNELDTDFGLTVKIDARKPENKDFIKRIAIRDARVLNLDDPVEDELFPYPGSMIRLILTGKVSPVWFNTQISAFVNLTKLVLRGGFLTSYDLQSPSENPNDEVTFSSAPICTQPNFLPSLESLEIIANEFAYNAFYLPLAIRLRDPLRASQTEHGFNQTAMTVAKNISFLLSSIRSPELKMLQVYSYQKPGVVLTEDINWKFHPLETFLEYHKTKLVELYLPEFEGKQRLENRDRAVPWKLSRLLIELGAFIGDREQGHAQDTTYWKDLITSQTALKAIELQLNDMSQEWLANTLSQMCRNNRRTLTFIELNIQMDDNFELTCGIFSECDSLEVLRLGCRENEAFLTNFTLLPASLKKLRLTSCFIITPNPEEIKKFTNLTMLEMSILMLDGGMHERSLAVVQELLHLRNLHYLGVSFNENAGNNPDMRAILEQFSLFWDPRFRFSGLKINYGYEIQEGWSDEYFDETETNRDFINLREPENLPSYGTSFLNVETDDPRVILFHNIPILLRTIALHDQEDDEDLDDDLDNGLDDDDDDDEDFF